jgi:hypothetical protein
VAVPLLWHSVIVAKMWQHGVEQAVNHKDHRDRFTDRPLHEVVGVGPLWELDARWWKDSSKLLYIP